MQADQTTMPPPLASGRARALTGASGIRARGRDAAHLGVLAVVWLSLWLPRLSGPIDLRFDAGVYYILGTALAGGDGYRLLNEPGEIQAVQYPPVLPLVVAAHQWLLDSNNYLVVAPRLRLFFFLLFGALVLAVYWLARAYVRPAAALLVAIVTAASLNVFYLADLLYTEIPFALVTVGFFLCARRSRERGFAVAAAVLACVGFLLRTAGLALLAAWVAEALLRRRYRDAAVRAAVALIPVLLWQGYVARVTTSEEYRNPAYPYQRAAYYYSNVTYPENSRLVSPFSPELGVASSRAMMLRAASNLAGVPYALGEAVSAPTAFWQLVAHRIKRRVGSDIASGAVPVAIWVLGGLTLVGLAVHAARGDWLIPLYVAASVALVSLTPWPEQFTRYFTPLAPFLALFAASALLQLPGRPRPAGRRLLVAVASIAGLGLISTLLLVQSYSAYWTFRDYHQPVSYYDRRGNITTGRLFYYSPSWQAVDTALEWVRRNASPGDVIASSVPHTAYVRTGLKSVLPPLETDADTAQRLLDAVPVRYIVLDELDYPGFGPRYAAPTVASRPDDWRLVYVAGDGEAKVFERVHRADAGEAERPAAFED
jgi:hypothetical protein